MSLLKYFPAGAVNFTEVPGRTILNIDAVNLPKTCGIPLLEKYPLLPLFSFVFCAQVIFRSLVKILGNLSK